mgnify:CR=1 FL=1
MRGIKQQESRLPPGRLRERDTRVTGYGHHNTHRVVSFIIDLGPQRIYVWSVGLTAREFQFDQVCCSIESERPVNLTSCADVRPTSLYFTEVEQVVEPVLEIVAALLCAYCRVQAIKPRLKLSFVGKASLNLRLRLPSFRFCFLCSLSVRIDLPPISQTPV